MIRAVAGVALCATLASCNGARERDTARADSATPGTAALTSPEGNPVRLATLPARRIVSTMQSATEWIVALGAGDRLVARTDFDRQPELASLPSIGGGLNPSPEAIRALAPDVVIGWADRSSVDLEQALRPFGIPVVSMETTDTADIFLNLAQIGAILGRTARADSLAASLRRELAAARASCTDARIESALIVLWTDPPQTAGSGNWMHEILGLACLQNAFADVAAPWPKISIEAITARQPAWIVTSAGERAGQRLEEFRDKPGWRDLGAVKAGRIIEVPGDLFARAGPTVSAALAAIISGRAMIESGAGRGD